MQAQARKAIVIDGRSGSGKTQLADRLEAAARAAGLNPVTMRVEDLYPGWQGLADGALELPVALARGSYLPYDWVAEGFGPARAIGAGEPLIVEGCGALTAATLAALEALGCNATSVWLDAPRELRKTRAIARDGDMYAPHWAEWAAQEDTWYRTATPWLIADLLLDAQRGPSEAEIEALLRAEWHGVVPAGR